MALRLVRDAARADDLVQETLLAALEKRPDPGRSLRPWLKSVLTKRWAYGSRSEARRRDRERLAAAPEGLPGSDELAEQVEAHAHLVQALTLLREPYRTSLLMRYYEGLKPREIARRLGLPGATVRSHLKRGLIELSEILDARHGGERRGWCVALAPLAAEAPDAGTFAYPFPSIPRPLRAMPLFVQVIAASTVLFFAGTFVAQGLDDDPSRLEAAGEAVVLLDPSTEVVAPATTTFASERTVAVIAAPLEGRGGSSLTQESSDGPVVGTVKLTGTETGLAEFAVRLKVEASEGEGEVLWTDESGRFESELAYGAGTVFNVALWDHPDLSRVTRTQRQVTTGRSMMSMSRTWHPDRGPMKFKTLVGPTFSFELTAPFEVDPDLCIATLEAVQSEPWGALPASYQMQAPLRAGEPTWTRFLDVRNALPVDRPWLLRVVTKDGLWAGGVEVPSSAEVHAEPIDLILEPVANLEVSVLAPEVYTDMIVSIEHAVDSRSVLMIPTGVEERGSGIHAHSYQLQALASGTYRIHVSRDGQDAVVRDVALSAGATHSEEIGLAANVAQSIVRGELRSTSGQYKERMTLFLSGESKATETMRTPSWQEENGVWVAPFEFDNLPADTYEIRIFSMSDHRRWDGERTHLALPAEDVVLTCLDTEPAHDIVVSMKAAGSGESILTATASLSAAGLATPQMATGGGGRMFFRTLPVDAEFTWWAQAPGHVPSFGDESALTVGESGGRIDVELELGWGGRVHIVDVESGQALEGVRVLFDGETVGTTDASGSVDLLAASVPTDVDFVADGRWFVAGDYDPATRLLKGFDPIYSISMGEEP